MFNHVGAVAHVDDVNQFNSIFIFSRTKTLKGRLRGLAENDHVLFFNLQMTKQNERRIESRRHHLAIKRQAAQEENERLMLKIRTIHKAARVLTRF